MSMPVHSSATRPFLSVRRMAFLFLSSLACVGPMPASSLAQQRFEEVDSKLSPYAAHTREAAWRFGIPEHWIWTVMQAESSGRIHAISSKGAMGLMQLMPDTWTELRARYRLGSDPYDPRDNILAGAAYLREMHDRYGAPGFLAAYNAGPARYDDYLSTGRPLPIETVAYVAALAPAIGTDPLPGSVVTTAADPNAWTRSPLFVARANNGGSAVPVQGDRRSKADHTANPEHNGRAAQPPIDGIFVSRSRERGRP